MGIFSMGGGGNNLGDSLIKGEEKKTTFQGKPALPQCPRCGTQYVDGIYVSIATVTTEYCGGCAAAINSFIKMRILKAGDVITIRATIETIDTDSDGDEREKYHLVVHENCDDIYCSEEIFQEILADNKG